MTKQCACALFGLVVTLCPLAPATGQEPKPNQNRAVTAIKKLGGVVRFDPADPKKPWSVGLQGVKLTEADLKCLAALPSLKVLVLKRATFPTGLKPVGKLAELEILDLMDTGITDADLQHLEGLTRLKTLVLGLNPGVTDAGLGHLKKLTSLESLNLAGTQVTDDGLKELKGLKKLKYLNLAGTKVTREGVDGLELALPGVGIISTAR